jgi:hypothetical protein
MVTFEEHGYTESDKENIYYWKVSALWKLTENLPLEQIPLDSFDWISDSFQCNSLSDPPLWRDIGDHAKRILAADLQYPIIINAAGDIMDGMHRILKCYVFGLPSVNAVRFKTDPPPDRVIPKNETG